MAANSVKYYRTKLVTDGPWCAVSVWYGPPVDPDTFEPMDRAWRWQATLHGEPVDINRVATLYDHYNPRLGCSVVGEPIDKKEHDYIVSLRDHVLVYEPDAPEAAPRSKIDVTKMAPIKFAG